MTTLARAAATPPLRACPMGGNSYVIPLVVGWVRVRVERVEWEGFKNE